MSQFIAAIKSKFQDETDAAIEVERAKAISITITPEIVRGLASNADWIMRNMVNELQCCDDNEEECEFTFSMKTARKLPGTMATIVKALCEYAEILDILEKAQAA